MSTEFPGGQHEQPEEPGVERIQEIEAHIGAEIARGNFDEVLKLSLERAQIQETKSRLKAEQAQREALPAKLRESIGLIEDRIRVIEDGSFSIPDPATKEIVLVNIKERLEDTREDLLIAEGARPSYEAQNVELRKEIGGLIEQYARRWAELIDRGDEARILAFLDGIRRDALEYPDTDPYESAKKYAAASLAQHMDFSYWPREERNILRYVKNQLEEALQRSE